MSDQTTPDAELISHMLESAEEEAASIRNDAEKSAADRRRSLEQRLKKIKSDAEERVAHETQKLRVRTDATIELERNRSRLRMENRIYREVDEGARAGLLVQRSSAEYGDVLCNWITEAALGLGATEATVASPPEDRDTVRRALDNAVSELKSKHDTDVTLTLDEETEIHGQGVVLRNVPPTMAYSNTVDDRMRRFGPEIRSMVFRTIIEEAHE